MRKCLRCNAEMTEGLSVVQSDSGWPVMAAEPRTVFPKEVGKLSCAVCPECGYVELYIIEKKQ